ncbi:M23 family peptidase [Candidatus Symbiothrix dinenymphae]|nr:M23 family peptidase [Candidatus Symbiothrix dinenymphae]
MKARKAAIQSILGTLLMTLCISNAQAQGIVRREVEPMQPVNANSAEGTLLADHQQTDMETALVDSMLSSLDEEEEIPADELYDSWNTDYLKAYAGIEIPETYDIDVSQFVMPIKGRVTSNYGMRRLRRSRRMHKGTDFALHKGDTIRAAFDGKVRIRNFDRRGYGYFLVLRHDNGLETVYGHLSGFIADQNETVKAGQPIGLGGNTGRSTGPHLHFEFRFLGLPINPAEIIDFKELCVKDDHYLFSKKEAEAAEKIYTASASNSKGKVKYHRVRKGETLFSISRKTGVSVDKLRKLNKLNKGAILPIGKTLRTS